MQSFQYLKYPLKRLSDTLKKGDHSNNCRRDGSYSKDLNEFAKSVIVVAKLTQKEISLYEKFPRKRREIV